MNSGSGNSQYTCLFVNSTVPELKYSKTDAQIIFPFRPTDGSGGLTIYWDDDSGGNTFNCLSPGSNPDRLPAGCNSRILRVEITDANLTFSKVFFVYPRNGGAQASIDFGTAAPGSTPVTRCSPAGNPPQRCSVSITGVQSGSYVRVRGIYGSIAVTAVANSGAPLASAQATIDATGKAGDVERRIQVRIPLSAVLKDPPPYGLEGADRICKKFSVGGGTIAFDNGPCATGTFPD